jgi:hypothetical protein
MIEQNIHHQFKYLVLHGTNGNSFGGNWQEVSWQSKLMEHYGHGDIIIWTIRTK